MESGLNIERALSMNGNAPVVPDGYWLGATHILPLMLIKAARVGQRYGQGTLFSESLSNENTVFAAAQTLHHKAAAETQSDDESFGRVLSQKGMPLYVIWSYHRSTKLLQPLLQSSSI